MHQPLLLRQWSEGIVFLAQTLELSPPEREREEAFGVNIVQGRAGQGDTCGNGKFIC
ncbi:hypothetical protein [Streptomyces sp. NPDC058240]|uniref:hypothetical protein n=1 Tax=Streptomyces sp. NPDC058240 TaxID=3346396 RepID=UPI0036E4F6BA